MRRTLVLPISPYPGVVLGLLLLVGGSLHAQAPPQGRTFGSGMMTGIGYTAVMPDVMAGVGIWRFLGDRRIGVFSDFKATLPSIERNRGYCPPEILDCRVAWVERERNDLAIRDIDEYVIFNLGGLWALTPEFALLLGAGPVRRSLYREFFHDEEDQEARITDSGGYYVPHDPRSSWAGQVVVGVLVRMGQNLVFRFGYETEPGGMSLGGYWVFSW